MADQGTLSRQGLFDCTGMVAVITGGGTGIGLMLTRALAANGATVYILGRRLSRLQEAAEAAKSLAGQVIPVECDVLSKTSLSAAAAHIASETGYVNLVIANAGMTGPANTNLQPAPPNTAQKWSIQDVQKELWDMDEKELTDVYRMNVVAAQYTAVAFLDLLDKGNKKGNLKQSSQIIVTCSIGAFHRNFMSTGLAYLASKAATVHMTKCLASFFVQYDIRVNALAPGLFPSEMLEKFMPGKDLTLDNSAPRTFLPMGRVGRPSEMGGTILYMASEAGAYLSGSVQVVDGGRLGAIPGSTY